MILARLSALDYAVIACYLLVLLAIGWRWRRRARDGAADTVRPLPPWLAAVAMMSANVGAVEAVGMGGAGAKYGMASLHLYWLGAIPALLVLALVVLPAYAATGARSLPEYLRLRFGDTMRTVAAAAFAVMTIVCAGVSMYAMGKVLHLIVGASFATSVAISVALVLLVVLLGSVMQVIYHEVVQWLLLILLVVPLSFLGLRATGGWSYLKLRLTQAAVTSQRPLDWYTQPWSRLDHPSTNALGVEWIGLLLGIGFILTFGYWCTDYLVTQRALAESPRAGASGTRSWRAPLAVAASRLVLPLLLIVPGMSALIMGGGESGTPYGGMGQGIITAKRAADGTALLDAMGRTVLDFDLATPLLLAALAPPGLLGVGVVALVAACLSGMVGNLTAFRTVWRHDLAPRSTWASALAATVVALGLAAGSAYGARAFNNVMELLQLVFAIVNAPLLAMLALGLCWSRATGTGAVSGALSGMVAALGHHGVSFVYAGRPGIAGGYLAPLLIYRSELALAAWTAIVAFTVALVMGVVVSLLSSRSGAEERGATDASRGAMPAAGLAAHVRGNALMVVLLLGAAVAVNVIFAK